MKEVEALSRSEVLREIDALSDEWQYEVGTLQAVFEFESFTDAVDCVNEIAEVAEEMNHHPSLKIFAYNSLEVRLQTHSLDAVTNVDVLLAKRIDELVQ